MKPLLVLPVLVAVLKVLISFDGFIRVLAVTPPNLPAEMSALVTIALLIGGIVHRARRGTVIPTRPHLWIVAGVLVAPLLALGLAAPSVRATWSLSNILSESVFVWFQAVGLWMVGGVLFGGPFAAPRSGEPGPPPGRRRVPNS